MGTRTTKEVFNRIKDTTVRTLVFIGAVIVLFDVVLCISIFTIILLRKFGLML